MLIMRGKSDEELNSVVYGTSWNAWELHSALDIHATFDVNMDGVFWRWERSRCFEEN